MKGLLNLARKGEREMAKKFPCERTKEHSHIRTAVDTAFAGNPESRNYDQSNLIRNWLLSLEGGQEHQEFFYLDNYPVIH